VQYFGVDTFTTGIYRTWYGLYNPVAAAQLASCLMLFVFLVLLLERAARGQAQVHHSSTRYRPLPAHRLKGAKAALAFLTCVLPILIGFLIPALALLRLIWNDDSGLDGERMLRLSGNSFLLDFDHQKAAFERPARPALSSASRLTCDSVSPLCRPRPLSETVRASVCSFQRR